jgi:hypothetical protein
MMATTSNARKRKRIVDTQSSQKPQERDMFKINTAGYGGWDNRLVEFSMYQPHSGHSVVVGPHTEHSCLEQAFKKIKI